MIIKVILLIAIIIGNLKAQLYWSGEVNVPYHFYINNFKNTKNPIRFSKLKINYSLSDFDFKSTTALEYQWHDDTSIESTSINFREYYFSYYPSFGEINIGKQIVSWGFADGNNPTDNINPYDLNYMFETGIERKVGIHSISSIIYYNEVKMNFVLSYDNIKNIKNQRLPLPLPESNNKNQIEYGFDFQYNMNDMEINLSYLNKKNVPVLDIPDLTISESDVNMLGINLLYLYNDLTFRFENAIFFAEDNEKFYQGIFQLELPEIFGFTIANQLFGTYNIDDSVRGIYSIGSPVFLLTEASPLFATSISRTFNDDIIEMNIFTMFEILDGYGTSIGLENNYNITDNLNASINLSYFLKGNSHSAFNTLNNYSNIKLNIRYSF